MISAIEMNLHRGVKLLNSISNEQYSNTSIAPYYSSIGRHMRHILDVFDCVCEGLPNLRVDLTARKRNEIVELDTAEGIIYFNQILKKLAELKSADLDQFITVIDDLGLGRVEQTYTLGGLLIQAHSHAIHHFASLGYIISQLGIQIPDEDFGFNPTTPKEKSLAS
ncbi:MAG: hypothetical protein BM563_05260 [Bacteroidetes bacterium MedPE-SWsnd-G1]|nr:MAG: hypothetical protein BM563_05260 [Bacteroidetes bacterium MedPE-SWsnd-G1]